MKMPQENNENCKSKLLEAEGNIALCRLLGNRCQSLATAVVQLYITEGPDHQQWIKRQTGVLCFVKDNTRKNYFFRVFNLKKNCMDWEQEMYNNLEYTESTSFLHIFEAENCLVAFNFADSSEAQQVKSVVDLKISMKKRKNEKKALRHSQHLENHRVMKPPPIDYNNKGKKMDGIGKNKVQKKLTKADISTPMDFKHVSHVGWNPLSGFDIDSKDEELNKLFVKAGVSEKQLQDKETREFIYDFINKHGGREAVTEENNLTGKRTAPYVPTGAQGPPIPPRGTIQRAPHIRAAPPPPPNQTEHKPAPVIKPAVPPPPAAGFNAPAAAPAPPPPPPPMMEPYVEAVNPLLSAAPPPPLLPPVASDNSAFLDSIRSGTTLKPVEERKMAPAVVEDDGRNDLLSEIRKGFKLKPVDERDIKPVSNGPTENSSNDLAGALARALAERSKAIHSEDDDDDTDEDDNDDEWDE